MKPRYLAILVGNVAAMLALASTAQTIEISSPTLGTVKVRPAPIAKATPKSATSSARIGNAAASGARTVNAAPSSRGVVLGIRRNRDGSLYDPLDPRQNPAAAPSDARVAAAAPNAGTIAQGSADFPYGVNGGTLPAGR